MQKIITSLLFLSIPLFASLPEAQTEEELLHARRIIEFWRDQENEFTRAEINKFFQNYPRSAFHDYFYAILGDISVEEGRYAQALSSYKLIKSSEILNRVQLKRWNALYQLHQYQQLYQEIAPQRAYVTEEEGLFYFAEAAFREALAIPEGLENDEIRQRLFDEALVAYQSLHQSDRFGSHASLATAEIFRKTGRLEEAATLYLAAAEQQKSPLALYHAASLLLQCKQDEKATELFSRLTKSGGTKSSEAAYQWMQLLAKHKQWSLLHKERRLFLTTLNPSHLPIYHFYLGMLAYDEGHYDEAITPLMESLGGGLKPPYDKSALLALIASAKEIGGLKEANYAYQLIKDRYPEELEGASLMQAMCYRKIGEEEEALRLFSRLITTGGNSKVAEEAALEKIHLLINLKKWGEAHLTAVDFIDRFFSSTHREAIIKLCVDLALSNLPRQGGYGTLAHDLERALSLDSLYSEEERLAKQLLLAKCYFKLDLYPLSLELLHEMNEGHPEMAEVHYLLALCYAEQPNGSELVIAHGEKTLSLDPSFPEGDRLHLHLFNAYLELSRQSDDESLTTLAAGHLYAVIDQLPISLENQLWLANTYAKQVGMEGRALHILENVILVKQEHLTQYPAETLLLAQLYQQQERYSEAIPLLKPLKGGPLAEKVNLALALSFQAIGAHREASELLTDLMQAADSELSMKARLCQARIWAFDNQEGALKLLRELWVRKELQTEPIHLEAAIDYLDLVCDGVSPSKQLELLTEVKDYFTSQSDICSKDYHEARSFYPEKNILYIAYMRFLDAKIYEAQAMCGELSKGEALSKKKAAHALFSTLLQGKYAVTPYLVKKAEAEVIRWE